MTEQTVENTEPVDIQIDIEDMKPVFVAWTNTDLNEGRGFTIPYIVAESLETATRLGKGRSVQGADCRVSEHLGLKVKGLWLVPGVIHSESQEDHDTRIKREAKKEIMDKALEKGLSMDEIRILTG